MSYLPYSYHTASVSVIVSKTSGHLFWSCPRAKRIWGCSRIFKPNYDGQFNSFLELFWKMTMNDHCDEGVIALVGRIAWRLWGNRNEIRKGGKGLLSWSCFVEHHRCCWSIRKLPLMYQSTKIRWYNVGFLLLVTCIKLMWMELFLKHKNNLGFG